MHVYMYGCMYIHLYVYAGKHVFVSVCMQTRGMYGCMFALAIIRQFVHDSDVLLY